MTDDQEAAAMKSIATELSRLAHTWPLADDDEDRYYDKSMDLAHLVRVIPTLCPHNIAALSRLVDALVEVQAREPEHDIEDRRVQ